MSGLLEHVDDSCIEHVYVSRSDKAFSGGTSKGNQIKWRKGKKFIKLNTWEWYESISEVFVSFLLSFSSVEEYVEYFPCIIIEDGINVGSGCYSYSFINGGESCISLYRVLKNMGINMRDASYDCVRDIVYDVTGLDIKRYLDECLCVDAICCNEDRHLNNLSIIRTLTGYRSAPIFDNGLACLSDVFSYPFGKLVVENIKCVYSMPFYSSFERQLKTCKVTPINIDYYGFINSVGKLESREEKRAFDVIKYGLDKYRGLAWEEY